MILKRLKLFTIYVGPNGTAASDQQLRNIASGSAVNFAGQLGLPAPDANTGANTGNNAAASANTGANTGNNTNTGNNANANANTGANAGNNAAASANAGANAAKSVSVISGTQPVAPLKNANPKVTFDPNNVKLDKDALINNQIGDLKQQNSQLQSQLDAANKAKVESAARGRAAGRKQVGVWQGLENTWNKAGTMKKIGMGGAALAGTYFLGKGLLGGNNNNDQ